MALLSPLLLALVFIYASSVDWRWNGWRFSIGWDDRDYDQQVYHYSLGQDDDIKSLEVDIDFGLGYLWIGSIDDELFVGDFEYRYKKPKCMFDKRGDKGKIIIKTRNHISFSFFGKRRYRNDAEVFIADYLPLDIKLDIAAARTELDLSKLIVKNISLDAGAGDIEVRLGCKSDEVFLKIDSGASRVSIIVPEEMGLKIDSDIALSSTNFRRVGLKKYNGQYRSDNLSTADCRALIEIDSGVSQIEIDYY
jgi:hypothetical protein